MDWAAAKVNARPITGVGQQRLVGPLVIDILEKNHLS